MLRPDPNTPFFELKKFFDVFKLPEILINDKIYWQSFRSEIFAKVIDRPIIKPIPEIAEIRFFKCADYCLLFAIRYTNGKKYNVWPIFSSYQIKK